MSREAGKGQRARARRKRGEVRRVAPAPLPAEPRHLTLVFAAVTVALAVGAYANSLANGFVWDDPIILERQLPVFRSLAAVLFPPRNIPQFSPDYYRPLVVASYLLDWSLGGGEPAWFHLTVVLGHALTTLAVFVFGRALFRRAAAFSLPDREIANAEVPTIAAAFGAALFAVHPVHTEAVAWMAGRADVFATGLAVVAATAHVHSRRRPRLGVVTGVATLLALLAKEVAVALLVVLPVLDAVMPPPALRASRHGGRRAAVRPRTLALLPRYLPLATALGVYAALRLAAVGVGLRSASPVSVPTLHAADVLAAVGLYLAKLLAPLHLNAYIAELPRGTVTLAAAGVAVAAMVAAAVGSLLRRKFAVTALLAWTAAGILPSLVILVKIPAAPVAERYTYFPSVGFCLLVGWVGAWALSRSELRLRLVLYGGLVFLLAAGVVATTRRNRVWRSDMSLWSDTVPKSTAAGLPYRSLAASLLKAGRMDEADETYRLALKKRNSANGKITIYNNLGTIALQRGKLDMAEEYYRSALAVSPTPDCLFNLGLISMTRARQAEEKREHQRQRGHASRALSLLRRAERMSPHDPDIEAALGQTLTFLGRAAEGRQHYRRALDLGATGSTAEKIRRFLDESP